MKWTTVKRKINDFIPYENNPRQMTEKQNKDLTESLEKFDLVEIPAINQDGTVLAGHQRIRILQALGRGEEEIDVRIPDVQLSEEQIKEYNIRSNKDTGGWDYDKLANLFDTEKLLEWGFNEWELGIKTTEDFKEIWKDMPEFTAEDKSAFRQIIINFDNQQGLDDFKNLIGQDITDKTRSIWFPEHKIQKTEVAYQSES